MSKGEHKNTTPIVAVVTLIVGSGITLLGTPAQQAGIKRSDLQRHDLGVPGREVIRVRVDSPRGAAFGRHTAPGQESFLSRGSGRPGGSATLSRDLERGVQRPAYGRVVIDD
jgi:hypothetical protein